MRLQDVLHADESDPDRLQRLLSKTFLEVEQYGRSPESLFKGPGTLSGPRRYLQHMKPVQLWIEYSAMERRRNELPASLSTFMRYLNKVFGRFLSFRKKRSMLNAISALLCA